MNAQTTRTPATRAVECSKRNEGLGTHDFRALTRFSGLLSEPNKGQTWLKRPMSLSEMDVVHRAACVAGTGRSNTHEPSTQLISATDAQSSALCLQARGEAVSRSAPVPEQRGAAKSSHISSALSCIHAPILGQVVAIAVSCRVSVPDIVQVTTDRDRPPSFESVRHTSLHVHVVVEGWCAAVGASPRGRS